MKKLYSSIFAFALVFIFLFTSFKLAQAQEFATSINPPILFIEAEAPADVTAPITIQNQSDQNITYSIFLRPFTANTEENGIPNYDPDLKSEYKPFLDQVRIFNNNEDITQISLGPKQKKELNLRINVDENLPPGDRYFTVLFLSENENETNNSSMIGAKGGIGTNVLLTIGPKTEPKGRIAKFSAPKLISRGPVPFELELANHSDYYVIPEGNILITNVFGHAVGSIDIETLSILSNSNRVITDNKTKDNKLYWNEKYPIGFYKATAKVALSEKGPLLTEEITFFAFPVEILLGGALIIIIFIWLFKYARKKASEND